WSYRVRCKIARPIDSGGTVTAVDSAWRGNFRERRPVLRVLSSQPRGRARPDSLSAIRIMQIKRLVWKLKEREVQLGDRTLLCGILNVTPDSFSDGGKYSDPDRAFAHALELEEAGADIIDIGAESTRPGSSRVSEAEELRRLVPVLKRLRGRLAVPICVD